MNLEDAIRKRIEEILNNNNTNLTALCLNSNITPSTVFDFMYKKSKSPKISTIKKLCVGAGLTLSEFFNRPYFNDSDEVYS